MIYLHKYFQRAYRSKKKFIVAYGGRSGGKTLSTGIILLAKSLQETCRILCTRKYQNKISDSVYTVLVGLINTYPEFKDRFEVLRDRIRCIDTGSEFIFMGLQHIEDIKSLQGVKYVWLEESNDISEYSFETLSKTIRVPDAQIYVIFNPNLETDYVYKRFVLNSDPMAMVIKINWSDNPFFKAKYVGSLVEERLLDKEKDLLKYNWIWEGECRSEVEGALWTTDLIRHCTTEEYNAYLQDNFNQFKRIIVAIDPSITSKQTSDACGLVVAGELDNGHLTVIEDQTKIMSPDQWATKAVELYHYYKADGLIVESNQGGDMIKTIIHRIDKLIRVRLIHATRGKYLRAEPVLHLYEQGKVKHLKRFPTLEYEMVTFTGDQNDKSPNALDAMVYALTDLSKISLAPSGMVRATQQLTNVAIMRPRH